jgi:hypothetical protein
MQSYRHRHMLQIDKMVLAITEAIQNIKSWVQTSVIKSDQNINKVSYDYRNHFHIAHIHYGVLIHISQIPPLVLNNEATFYILFINSILFCLKYCNILYYTYISIQCINNTVLPMFVLNNVS